MFISTCFALLAIPASAAEDSIVVRAEFDPNTFRAGDVAFGRVTIENRGEEAIENMPTKCASFGSTAFYSLSFGIYPYSFRFDNAPSASGQGRQSEKIIQPGEKWIVDYPLLPMPEPKYIDDEFWDETAGMAGQIKVTLREDVFDPMKLHLRGTKKPLPTITLHGTGSVYFRERPKHEMEFLRRLFRESEAERDAGGGDVVLYRPKPAYFGLRIVHEHLIERLIAFEDQLSPGTLRDIVKLTRLMRVLYSPEDPETRDATVKELLEWLAALPTIQREVFAIQLDASIRQRGQGGGRLDPRLHPEYTDLLRGVIQYMPENAYGSATFRQDHLQYLEALTEEQK